MVKNCWLNISFKEKITSCSATWAEMDDPAKKAAVVNTISSFSD